MFLSLETQNDVYTEVHLCGGKGRMAKGGSFVCVHLEDAHAGCKSRLDKGCSRLLIVF